MQTLGERLRKARKEARLTQPKLAEMIHVSQTLISRIERNEVQTTSEIFQLANALKLNAQWLATGEGEQYQTPVGVTPEEMKFVEILRGLTDEQKTDTLKDVERIKSYNDKVRAHFEKKMTEMCA